MLGHVHLCKFTGVKEELAASIFVVEENVKREKRTQQTGNRALTFQSCLRSYTQFNSYKLYP
jgi:hypothetical protein